MSKYKMISQPVPNVPWQERPENLTGAPVWRYNENPIIGRNPVKGVARIFNSAVMPYEDGFIGVFRGEQTNGIPYIYLGRSKDAIHWNFDENKINFEDLPTCFHRSLTSLSVTGHSDWTVNGCQGSVA